MKSDPDRLHVMNNKTSLLPPLILSNRKVQKKRGYKTLYEFGQVIKDERTSSDFVTFRIMHMKNQKTPSVSPGNSRSFTSSGLQSFQLVNIRTATGISQGTYSLTIHYEFFLEPCND
ncbi:S-Ena type endospore appendage [Marininema mesophilum]|uniref:S-Ena type endospore appendage n=1 Tax=Marininema mesophilum TaxID=1048340 RepID=UPI003CCC0054